MAYFIKEMYRTLQGEGAQAGRTAVFCRFAGCNLWSGRPEDREKAACWFCDTDFVGTDGSGGGRFERPQDVVSALLDHWGPSTDGDNRPYVVFTGGEPTLQLDAQLVEACHEAGFIVAIETNGTRLVPKGVDWICVSPKPGSSLVQSAGHELKFVFPQPTLKPEDFAHLDFGHFYIQPLDGEETSLNTRLAIEYCLAHPRWRLSLQTHKLIGIP